MMTTDPITEAQSPDTFDVFSFIEGTAYPTEEVTVYQDAKSATDLLAANDRRLEMDKSDEAQDYSEVDAEIAELTQKVKNSAMTFELRGMPPGMVRDLYNATDDAEDAAQTEAENKLIAGTIVAVRNASGARDARVWDAEGVEKLRRFLKEGEFAKLVQGVVRVNFNATVFDQATDAGFLGGSADVAA